MSAARNSKPGKTVIDLSRVREELDRLTERVEVPAELAAQSPDSRAGRQPHMGAALDALEVVDALDALEIVDALEAVDAAQPQPAAPPVPPSLTEEALRAAVASAAATGRSPVAVLAETSGLQGDALARALGAALHYPVLETAALMALAPAFDLLGHTEATQRGCVIVKRGAEHLAVIGNPFDLALRGWVELKVQQTLSWHLAAPDEITAYVAKFEQDLRAMDVAAVAGDGEDLIDGDIENLSLATISADSSPVVKLVHSTVYDALKAGASDIHLETRPSGLAIRYRVDGVLVHIVTLGGAELCEQVISRVKVMSELDIAERRVPQDGRFRIALKGRPIDFRVSVMPSAHGEDAVLRILDKQALTDELQGLRLDALGFEAAVVGRLRRLSELPYGMLLVTGPTGSGKTTTLYAAISETNTGRDKIVTIEDPGRVPAARRAADPGQREEGPDLRARPPVDPASRPGQDHGRGDPRSGDRADRDPVGADRPPRVHDRARQQRLRRARALHAHAGRHLRVRLGPERHPRAAPPSHHLRAVRRAVPAVARAHQPVGPAAVGSLALEVP